MWLQFTAVPQSEGAPLRTVTVRDAIADLPAVENGHDEAEMQYSGVLSRFVMLLVSCWCQAVKQTSTLADSDMA